MIFRLIPLTLLTATLVTAQDHSARDLTIRLFDTDRVTTLTLTPLSPATTWKPCATCPFKPLSAPLKIELKARSLTANGVPSTALTISGELRAETDTRRRAATAALWHVDAERDSLRLRVTLPSERYVAAVLMGEASADEPPASLRALAIAIRSFALTHAGDLADSTRTQAMRLGAVSPNVNEAVRDTAGETLWFHGSQVPAYFTQSSGGATESSSAAWGGPPQPWLPAQPDPSSDRIPSQWHAEVPLADIRTILAAEGFSLPGPVHSITILRRTTSGRAARLQIDRLQIPAATFRFAIDRALGWNRLRSDLYTVQISGPNAIFDGKGYGHGVGISQSGARTLALEGRDPATILRFYFPGTDIRITPADDGWQTHNATGWTLHSTGAPTDQAILKAGDASWQKALSLFPPQTPVYPAVRLFPSTPLFRSATGEPGWNLAATRGDQIYLQPASILNRNRPADLLLHEMLHVLVEHEATAPLPLWFREGLVEALAEPPSPARPPADISATESHLAHPASLAEARNAHREAAAIVRRLETTYSPATLRTWLHTGLPPGLHP